MRPNGVFHPIIAAFVSRIILISVQFAVTRICNKYDTSSAYQGILAHNTASSNSTVQFSKKTSGNGTVLDKCILNLLDGFGNWDSIYFLHISKYGYEYEQFMAFFPLFPTWISVLAQLMQTWLLNMIGHLAALYLAACLINVISFITAALFLHKLTFKVTKSSAFADLTVLLFCINPANIFNLASYSESLFMCSQFTALYFLEHEGRSIKYLYAGLLFGVGTATRSNGLVSAGFLIYSLLSDLIKAFCQKQQQDMKENYQTVNMIGRFVMFLLGSSTIIASFLAFQIYGYVNYCSKHQKITSYQDHWCFGVLPTSYTYIQSFYWNVGPFRYYELRQIPNFLLALPVIILGCSLIRSYFSRDGFLERITKYVCNDKIQSNSCKDICCNPILLPYICHLLFMISVGIVNVHIQVLTRMLFSSSPVLYWYAASHFFPTCKKLCIPSKPNLVLGYFISYTLLGVLIHCNFYPWT